MYRRAVLSAPVENIQGCVGCQTTENTPNSLILLCVSSFFSGTINGFCNRSLEEKGDKFTINKMLLRSDYLLSPFYSLVDHSVGHNNCLIVTARCKQWIPQMVCHSTNCLPVQTQRLIGFRGQIQIEPQHLLVVGGHEQIVSLGMHGHIRDPLTVGQQFLNQLLLHQIVNANIPLGLQVQKQNQLNSTFIAK